jgi:lipopolysaccharide export system protein LptC
MTSMVDERGARGYTASRPDNHAIFMRAQRHSRMVRVLRVAVPVGAVLLLVVVSLISWLDPIHMLARLPTASGSLVVSGSKITMEAPKLAGFTKDARAYELSARSAAQDLTNPDVIELRDIRATIESQDKSAINLTAVDGLYNRKSGMLKLAKDVLLTSSTYEVTLDEALIDTTSNNVTSDKPVQVKMLQGVVNAKRLEVKGGGDVVRFLGDVKMTLTNVPDISTSRAGSN